MATAVAVDVRLARREGDDAARPELQRVLDDLVIGPERIAPGATAYVSGPRGSGSGRPAWRTSGAASA